MPWVWLHCVGIEWIASGYFPFFPKLGDLVALVRGKLSKMQRAVLSALIVIEVHAKDVAAKLIEENITSMNDFEWISQLRLESTAVESHLASVASLCSPYPSAVCMTNGNKSLETDLVLMASSLTIWTNSYHEFLILRKAMLLPKGCNAWSQVLCKLLSTLLCYFILSALKREIPWQDLQTYRLYSHKLLFCLPGSVYLSDIMFTHH